MTDEPKDRVKPDSMMCCKCGTVVFHGVELDTQRCRCGVGAGQWACNYSKVSVSIIEHEDKIRTLEAENRTVNDELAAVMQLGIDKWLEGHELDYNNASRAATAREKVLRIIDSLKSENAELKKAVCELLNKQDRSAPIAAIGKARDAVDKLLGK